MGCSQQKIKEWSPILSKIDGIEVDCGHRTVGSERPHPPNPRAAAVAGPPSPEKPGVPVPAMVVMILLAASTLRIRLLVRVTDVEMASFIQGYAHGMGG